MPEWLSIILSAGAILGGVTYWAGRIARALEGVEAALVQVGVKQAETDGRVRALEDRVARAEVRIEIVDDDR